MLNEICMKCGKQFMPRMFKPITICDKCDEALTKEIAEKSGGQVERVVTTIYGGNNKKEDDDEVERR